MQLDKHPEKSATKQVKPKTVKQVEKLPYYLRPERNLHKPIPIYTPYTVSTKTFEEER